MSEAARGEYIRCAFVIPIVRDSDRGEHPPIAWRLLHENIRQLFDGYQGPQEVSNIRGYFQDLEPVGGEWTNPETGERKPDVSRKYTIAVRPQQVPELRSVLLRAGNTFDQQSVYFEVGEAVEFLSPKKEDGFLE